jgi:hypothetical protein
MALFIVRERQPFEVEALLAAGRTTAAPSAKQSPSVAELWILPGAKAD